MPRISRWILAGSLIFVVLAGLLFVRRYFSNQLEKRLLDKEVVPVRIELKDQGRKELLAQLVLYPEQKWASLYFINTDAHYPDSTKPISEQIFADNFEKYSGFKSIYAIELSRTGSARFIDLAEGLPVYLEAVQSFPGAQFQYPAGRSIFSGEQAMEYALSRRIQQGQEHLNGLERTRRMQSIILSCIWNADKIAAKIQAKDLRELAASFVESDLTSSELLSLAAFLSDAKVSVLEVPLEAGLDKRLVVKEKRARTVYGEFTDNLRSGRLLKDPFSLEVLNGTEVGGLARRVKQFLQDRGILVLNADNYPVKPVPRSVILVRAGRTSLGTQLMEMTALPRENVFFDRSTQDVDVTLLLGQDFDIKKLQVNE